VSLLRGWTGGLLPTFIACGVVCLAIAAGQPLLGRRPAERLRAS